MYIMLNHICISAAIGAYEFESLTRSQGISLDPEVVNPDNNFSARIGMHAISRCNFLTASLLVITPTGAFCR